MSRVASCFFAIAAGVASATDPELDRGKVLNRRATLAERTGKKSVWLDEALNLCPGKETMSNAKAFVTIQPRHLRAVQPTTLTELHERAVSSGAVARFIELMGGPPDFEGLDADDVRAFIKENAP